MPDMVIIEGIPPHDGEYEIDLGSLTMEEFHVIKRLTGIVTGQVEDALLSIDTDIFVGLAAVVIQRSGKRITKNVENQLWKSTLGQIKVKLGDDDPPALSQKTMPSGSVEPVQPSEVTGSSGDDGKDALETSEATTPLDIGRRGSEPSATSDPERSAA